MRHFLTQFLKKTQQIQILIITCSVLILNFSMHIHTAEGADETTKLLTKIDTIAQKIQERKNEWHWHDAQIQWHVDETLSDPSWHNKQILWHRSKQDVLHQANKADLNHCNTLSYKVFGKSVACPKHSGNGYWLLFEGNDIEYKNERITYAQDYAQKVGLGAFKLAIVAQLHTENGSWSETRRGDSGCSVGLSQLNTCARKSIRNHANLYDWKWQIRMMIDELKVNYLTYGDFTRAQIGWNNPAAMRAGRTQNRYSLKVDESKKFFQFFRNEIDAIRGL